MRFPRRDLSMLCVPSPHVGSWRTRRMVQCWGRRRAPNTADLSQPRPLPQQTPRHAGVLGFGGVAGTASTTAAGVDEERKEVEEDKARRRLRDAGLEYTAERSGAPAAAAAASASTA
ncbi:hypothetical protein Vretimale_1793 [Volvox reticuliferus]|nr:hypothetical protein Vretimale_1793 [Volvox reticuliferus]